MAVRDDDRHDAGHGGAPDEGAPGGGAANEGTPVEHGPGKHGPDEDTAHGGARRDVTYDGAVYGGMDALMAALTQEPLPARAERDADFLSARRAAAADVAVLREQLGLIGEALARAGETGARAGTAAGAREGNPPARDAGPAAEAAPASARPLPRRRSRRPLNLALGALAAAVAATVVVGMGWLLARPGGGADATSDAAGSADAGAKAGSQAYFGSPPYLACARFVAEGTVVAVERPPGTGQDRITLAVTRSYLPEGGGPEDGGGEKVAFVREEGVRPRLREGDEVLVGLPRDGLVPDAVFVGEEDIAPERARITAALPEARDLPCA
ncbi:hypothetical protein [Streptomyces sp. NPDC052701]|uniref:hypothetical protein n=1 Tax=Streptomyces sp. NPDC052701 TaxID=3155533 RepID=UPI00342C1A54